MGEAGAPGVVPPPSQSGGLSSYLSRNQPFTISQDLNEIWGRYVDENEEKFLRKFVKGFVGQWESQVCPSWEMLVTARLEGQKNRGPVMADLPDELLPALSKFLIIGRERKGKNS